MDLPLNRIQQHLGDDHYAGAPPPVVRHVHAPGDSKGKTKRAGEFLTWHGFQLPAGIKSGDGSILEVHEQ